jgi:hypothetical protein
MSRVPPPRDPIGAQGDWDAVVADVGVQLPEDYRQFISQYGAGNISGMIAVLNPLIQNTTPRNFWMNCVDIYRDIATYGVDVPFDLYPICPGLLPCASYGDVDIINWLTDKSGSVESLVYYSRSYGFFNLGRVTLTRFIIQLLAGSSVLPSGINTSALVKKPRQFRPGADFGRQ